MLKNQNIICLSSIDWDFIWQGHQEIMAALAGNGNRVLFIENTGVRAPRIRDIPRITKRVKNWFSGIKGIRREMDNLYVFSPLLLPFPYSRTALWLNKHLLFSVLEKWVKVMNFTDTIIWVFLPTPLSLHVVENLNNRLVVYYCIDNFRASSASAKKIADSETKLLKKADLVFVTSRELYNYSSSYNRQTYYFPFAVNFQEFERARLKDNSCPAELKGIKKPIIGYIGGVHKWIDFDLIKETASRLADYSFVFVGPVQADISSLSGLSNVHLLGKQGHEKIPDFINSFDACIIPYLISEYTRSVYPTKLNEYLAMGKPVISTFLPEVSNFNSEHGDLVSLAGDKEEFINYICQAVRDSDVVMAEKRISAAKKNSWANKIEEMCRLMQAVIDKKSKLPPDWKEGILKFYKSARKKAFKAALILASLYFIIFYTPLVWFLASPLKISQPLQKSDCIVVFAGGVGESGKAGQGYEERVKYAVELYKKGYAGNMIFSSGYMFVFKEPLVMKALAVSLGVPQEVIILEDKASGTYQNVKFTEDILLGKGWDKIILVDSPYHMKRVSLVFKKIAGNTKVRYAPLPNSLFYAHPERDEHNRIIWKRINIQQIKGILHEYLGIAYYRFKGYI